MLIQPIQVSPWQANCYLVASGEDATECLVIDPGVTGAPMIEGALERHGWSPAAILGTHGHIDHVGDAHVLAARWGVPCHLAVEDHGMLTHPAEGLGPQMAPLLQQVLGADTLPAIDDVRGYDGEIRAAGFTIAPFHAPGHTRGSTLLTVTGEAGSIVFTGDVLFAGSIGRTDLPGGNMAEMRESLRRIVESFPPDTALLPGHGQPTVLAHELESNPYLQPGN